MARTLFFRMVLRKFSEIATNKPIFIQYNIFYNYEYFFFQSAFWSPFNHRQKIRGNVVCVVARFVLLFLLCTHFGPLQCFSTYFRKLKKVGVLRPIFSEMLFLMTMIKIRNESLMNINFSIVNQCNCYQIC